MVKLEELNPRKSEIFLIKKKYTLKPFTLSQQIWVMNEFATEADPEGGQNLKRLLEKMDVVATYKLAFRLIEDKSDFIDYEDMMNKCGTGANFMRIMYGLSESIGLSEAMIDASAQEFLQVKKQQADSQQKEASIGPQFTTP